MPTEAEVEAARVAMLDTPVNASTRALARAALTAAEEVRGQVSGDDAAFLAEWEEHTQFCIAHGLRSSGATPAHVARLLALARRGAVQAVPDEAAIRADERERLAKKMDTLASAEFMIAEEAYGRPGIAGGSDGTYHALQARSYEFAANAIRAAAPKPEGKP